jgi:hypothetical protein
MRKIIRAVPVLGAALALAACGSSGTGTAILPLRGSASPAASTPAASAALIPAQVAGGFSATLALTCVINPGYSPGDTAAQNAEAGYGPYACYNYRTLAQVNGFGPSVTTWPQWCERQLNDGVPAASDIPSLVAGCEQAVAYAQAHPNGGKN